MREKQNPYRGAQLKLRSVQLAMILVACLLFALILYQTVRVGREYRALISETEDYAACEVSADQVRADSDYLTEQARLYTVTAKREHMEDYFSEAGAAHRRGSALEALREFFPEGGAYGSLQSALDASDALMEREIYAMKLISEANGYADATLPPEVRAVELSAADAALDPEAMTARAETLLFGQEYRDAKTRIYDYVSDFVAGAVRETGIKQAQTAQELERALLAHRLWAAALFLLSVLAFVTILILVVRPLKIYINHVKDNSMFELIGSYEFKHLALTYRSIYEVSVANQDHLKKRAEQDNITDLLNRNAFFRRAEELAGAGNPLALLLLDVDGFQEINDSYGRGTGDLVLKKVGRFLSVEFRTTDTPARLGADEFAVLMMDVTPEQQEVVRKKIERINGLLLDPDDGLPPFSLSVGVAFSSAGYTQKTYERADSALTRTKRATLGGCEFSKA